MSYSSHRRFTIALAFQLVMGMATAHFLKWSVVTRMTLVLFCLVPLIKNPCKKFQSKGLVVFIFTRCAVFFGNDFLFYTPFTRFFFVVVVLVNDCRHSWPEKSGLGKIKCSFSSHVKEKGDSAANH